MATWSDYVENRVLNYIFRSLAMPALPASVSVGLWNTSPTDAGTSPGFGGTEVSGTSYARVSVSTTGQWDAGSGGATANTNAIVFPTPGGAWTTANYVAILDDVATPNLLWYAAISNPFTAASGDTVQFQAGALDIVVDGSTTGTGAFSDIVENSIIDHFFRNTAFITLSDATNLHFALCSTNSSDSTPGTELTSGTGSYARATANRSAGSTIFSLATTGSTTNSGGAISWPASTAAYSATAISCVITDRSIATALASTQWLFWINGQSVAVGASGITPSIATSNCTISVE